MKRTRTLAQPEETVEAKQHHKYYLMVSFFVPMILLCIGFILEDVYPAGDRQILVTDFWHQYYPFLRLLHEKLQAGESILFSWETGLGTNFLAIVAYYAASPLNILTLLVPDSLLRVAVTVEVLLKAGFAGLFFAMFLKGTFHRDDFSLCLFSVMYALCSYFLGYYWCIIWLDTVALLPLVVLGLVYLVRDGKYRLYVIALAVSLFANYYIGLFTCIFAVIAYLVLCVFYLPLRKLPGRTGAMFVCSLLGGCLAAVMLLPAFFALQLTYSVQNTFPTEVEFYESWRSILANLISYQEPTVKEGLPNIACGVLSLILFGPFLRSDHIRVREKVAAVLVLGFLLLSCNMNILNFLWHGMHFPNMLPYRFSFLFSFTLLTMGYRAFTLVLDEHMKVWDMIAMLVMCVVVFLISYQVEEDTAVYWSFATALLYAFIIILYARKIFNKKVFWAAMAVVMSFEMFANTKLGTESVSTSSYDSYPATYDAVSALLEYMDENDDDLFYRTEMAYTYTINDPALYGYNGLSQFSSMANSNVSAWMRALGLSAAEAGNRYYYVGSTPVVNMFSSIRYLISRSGTTLDTLSWSEYATAENSTAYINEYDLPIAFMTDSDLLTYEVYSTGNPFENQNSLFQLATGIDEPLYTAVALASTTGNEVDVVENSDTSLSYSLTGDVDEASIEVEYLIEEDCYVYGYVSCSDLDDATCMKNGNDTKTYSVSNRPYIFPLGEYEAGDTAGFTFGLEDADTGTATVYLYIINEDVLNEGYELLSDETITLTEFTDTGLTGTITAEEDGLCYFSIPYDTGWTATVDGEEVELESVGDAMVALSLTAGTHTITLSYTPNGFVAGVCITVGSIVILVVLYVIERKRGKPFLEPIDLENTVTVEMDPVVQKEKKAQSEVASVRSSKKKRRRNTGQVQNTSNQAKKTTASSGKKQRKSS